MDDIDDDVMNICERFAWWLQKKTGVNNFTLAKYLNIFTIVASIFLLVDLHANLYAKESYGSLIMLGLFLIYGVGNYSHIGNIHKKYKKQECGVMNYARTDIKEMRLRRIPIFAFFFNAMGVAFAIVIVSIHVIEGVLIGQISLTLAFMVCIFLFLCVLFVISPLSLAFAACTPLDGGKSDLEKLKDKVLGFFLQPETS